MTAVVVKVGVFSPQAIPYSLLGPLGSFLYYMFHTQQTLVRVILVGAVAIHIGEATYAYILTRQALLYLHTDCRI